MKRGGSSVPTAGRNVDWREPLRGFAARPRIDKRHKTFEYLNMLREFKAEFFRALAHPLRIQILDALRRGELSVGEIGERLGVEQSTVSQQLAVLRSRNFLNSRKSGTNIFYSVRDREVFRLLDCARTIFNNQLISVQAMLAEMEEEKVKV